MSKSTEFPDSRACRLLKNRKRAGNVVAHKVFGDKCRVGCQTGDSVMESVLIWARKSAESVVRTSLAVLTSGDVFVGRIVSKSSDGFLSW